MTTPHAFFLAGTDTGIGKTFVTCALLHAARAHGHSAVGYKPLAAGAELIDGKISNEDARNLQAASTPGFTLDEINPLCLQAAMAPHIAAEREGRQIDMAMLLDGYHHLAARADRVLVEGVGGLLVPINATQDSSHLAQALGLPVILVVGIRLGCLSHALLTAEAIRARGLVLAGWVANRIDREMDGAQENIDYLRQRLGAPLLGDLPWQANGDASALAGLLRWPTA